jgi:hypothetical protein
VELWEEVVELDELLDVVIWLIFDVEVDLVLEVLDVDVVLIREEDDDNFAFEVLRDDGCWK